MSLTAFPRLGAASSPPLRVVVAIPARDEEQRVGKCLRALAGAARRAANVVDVRGAVLLLNNCADATAARAEACRPTLPFPLLIIETLLPPARAHAGVARRLACDHAAALLDQAGGAGALLVTDADSCVTADWLVAHARAFGDGADVVAGHVRIDPADMALWPRDLRRRERREAAFGELLCELAARIDPDPRNPWPHHDQASGASLGVTLAAYRRIGGVPEQAVGEDRAFVAAAKRLGCRVRHDAAVCVITSGRMQGRAAGGKADTISYRSNDARAACDERLEPLQDALRRFSWRRELRLLHAGRSVSPARAALWSERLVLPVAKFDDLAATYDFASFWQALEMHSPALARAPVHPHRLLGEIVRARALLGRLRPFTASAAIRLHDNPAAVRIESLGRSG